MPVAAASSRSAESNKSKRDTKRKNTEMTVGPKSKACMLVCNGCCCHSWPLQALVFPTMVTTTTSSKAVKDGVRFSESDRDARGGSKLEICRVEQIM